MLNFLRQVNTVDKGKYELILAGTKSEQQACQVTSCIKVTTCAIGSLFYPQKETGHSACVTKRIRANEDSASSKTRRRETQARRASGPALVSASWRRPQEWLHVKARQPVTRESCGDSAFATVGQTQMEAFRAEACEWLRA